MIIDAHVHVGSWMVNKKDYGYNEDQLKQIMKDWNIDKMCILPIGLKELFEREKVFEINPNNKSILEICKKDDSFIPIFWVNPFKENEYRKAIDNSFKGLKYHPDVHLLPISDEKMKPLIETAMEFGVPIFIHTNERSEITSIFRIQEVAKIYPEVNFFALHSINRVSITCFKAKENGLYDLDNVYYCTGGRTHFLEFKFLYDNVGADHIIFSSDLPFGHPGVFMKYIELLTTNRKEREMMLGENIQKILKL